MSLTYTMDDSAGITVWTAQTAEHEVRIMEIAGVDYKCEVLVLGAVNRRVMVTYTATLEDAQRCAHNWLEGEG